MNNAQDWRVTNQERYLRGVTLIWRTYAPASPSNDHDHCEFCFAKFMPGSEPETFQEGYATVDGYRWICKQCFNDFAELFAWQVAGQVNNSVRDFPSTPAA